MTTDTRLWHPWLRINRVLRVMLQALERVGVVHFAFGSPYRTCPPPTTIPQAHIGV
jgi:hypothetical protein